MKQWAESSLEVDHAILTTYRQRLLAETRLVNLHGIPLPLDRSGRAIEPEVPLDKVYIRIQAIEEKQRRQQEEAEMRDLEADSGTQYDGDRRSTPERDSLDAIRRLGEYFYRRGEVHRATQRPDPIDPEVALHEHRRVVILGAPGAGKSTLLRYLARRAAENAGRPVPILVPLRDYAAALSQDSTLSLLDFALRHIASGNEKLGKALAEAIEQKRVLWLLDALDEARHWARRTVEQADDLPGEMILTSRPVGYVATGRMRDYPHFEVLPLTPDNVEQFLRERIRSRNSLTNAPNSTGAMSPSC